MVGSGGVVTSAFRGVSSYEYAAGSSYAGAYGPRICGVDYQVFRGIALRKFHHIPDAVEDYAAAFLQGFGREFRPVGGPCLPFQLVPDLYRQVGVVAHQHHLAVPAVFRLGEQVRRHETRVGVSVGYDHHLGRSCRHVYGDAVP